MELGLTFPLQRFLRYNALPRGMEADRRLCWDLHVITLRGQKSLLAVHCHSRYAFVRFAPSPAQWRDPAGLFFVGLRESLCDAGFSPARIEDAFCHAGAVQFTRTHGRREVAFLNRAWEDVLALDLCLDPDGEAQPLLDHAVNTRASRCAGCEGLGTGLERMAEMLR